MHSSSAFSTSRALFLGQLPIQQETAIPAGGYPQTALVMSTIGGWGRELLLYIAQTGAVLVHLEAFAL